MPRRQAPAATEPNNTQTQGQVEKPSGERAVSLSRLRLVSFVCLAKIGIRRQGHFIQEMKSDDMCQPV